MAAANTTETSVNLHQTKRRNNPEGSHFHTNLREHPKSNLISSHAEKPSFAYIEQEEVILLRSKFT
jgi:hypothetical protein